MQSTIVLGWMFLLYGAHSEGPQDFAQRISNEPELQQLIEYLRNHKAEVIQYLLNNMQDKVRDRMCNSCHIQQDILSYLEQGDIQWYLDNVQSKS